MGRRAPAEVFLTTLLLLGIVSFVSQMEVTTIDPLKQWLRQSPFAVESKQSQRLTLPEITKSFHNYSCPPGLVYVHDTVLPDYDSQTTTRLIPRVIHMTAKSRCVTPTFAKNVEKWRFPDHSLFFHDDEAVQRFVSQDFPLFPHFSQVMTCITSGAAMADLWRYLMIWEHGGIYTDFDNAPAAGFLQGKAIKDTDDAWFPLEALGVVAQFFFATSRQHPMMYFSLQSALMEILRLNSIRNNNAAHTTGPHATKMATIYFLKASGIESNGYIPAGLYVGANNRTMRVVGSKTNPREFVMRDGGIPGHVKKQHYKEMGMKHFSQSRGAQQHSCVHHIFSEYAKETNETSSLLPVYENVTFAGTRTNDRDCECPNTCNATALAFRDMRFRFTCKERIEYLMSNYGDSESKACSAAVATGACGPQCDPKRCGG